MSTYSPPAVSTLTDSACWAHLRSAAVGRLAVCVKGQPEILPINYVVDHTTIVFRTAEGTKFSAAVAGGDLALEADGYDPETSEAWSVVIKGSGKHIVRPDDLIDTTELPLLPWHPGPKDRFIRILAREITGRRFHVADSATWRTPVTGSPHAPSE
ncbi:pyridoxamine 5'-phosphate oxidase family protein [Leekyejoonella antrihumi]|uniref:Pyridoxamine 5'-phosphate oxidase family protein n=1 Tax=Leekyejoonella antrihumi TaxID=1660198 RepID=A0A563E0C8_9MICO|nr:pyridoxamine 5'-phosphate oxidase family protein [Leekyejoonella antrihumi]TWP35829.1 pyridoxamine 5'-phosphate oxidase family protein [Leekyejoonella antrihumi]